MSIIHKDIASIREDYSKFSLDEKEVAENPVDQFQRWFNEAVNSKVIEPNAMVLSTVSEEGFPSSRVVLFKYINTKSFFFF